MPAIVIGVILMEYLPKRRTVIDPKSRVTSNKQQPNPEIEKILKQRGKNTGKRLSQEKIIDNTIYILDNYNI
jgi:hypothetical protein